MRIQIIFTAILFSLLTSCSNSNKTKTQLIKIATLKGPSAMGMIRIIDSLNQTENANIEISIYNEPIQVRKLMLKEEVDFAILPTTMAAIMYNKDVPYQLAAIPVWGTLYLFGNDATIHTWDDLKRKRIHLMAKGMTPDVLFKYLLLKNGIDPERDVILDYSFPTHIDLANAVAANQADLAVISEPLVSLVMQKNKSVYPIMDLNKEWQKVNITPIAQTALLVSTEFVKENPKALKEILESYKRSTQWVNENSIEAAELIVKYNILPSVDVAKSSIPRSNLHFEEANKIKDQINEYLKIFFDLDPDIVGGKIPDDNFYLY
ncbi:ABC transporter substrate-binding protein [Bacteroidota bacterium]